MKPTIKILCIVLMFAIKAALIQAQEVQSFMRPVDSIASASKETFSSVEGRFSIALPKSPHGYKGTNGGMFPWRLNEGYYYIGYTDREQDVEASNQAEEKALQVAKENFNEICQDLLKTYPSSVKPSNKSIKFEGHAGVELRIEMLNGLSIIRVFWVKSRAYILAVMMVGNQQTHEATALRVFDSLKLTSRDDADAIIRKKVEEATPKPLPQSPVVKKLKTDAEDDGLKGKVKSVIEETQGLSGQMANKTRRRSSENYYDEQGNQIKRVLYSSEGQPFDITVYGYIDNKRVSNTGFIRYESDPPPMLVAGSGGKPKKFDSRYQTRYEYKYDAKGNLIEMLMYHNDDSLYLRYVYEYSGNTIKGKVYSEDGSLNSQDISILDAKGNITESTYYDAPLKGWDEKLTYKYEEFDAQGNWIKRIETLTRVFGGRSKVEWSAVEYRTITYY